MRYQWTLAKWNNNKLILFVYMIINTQNLLFNILYEYKFYYEYKRTYIIILKSIFLPRLNIIKNIKIK